MFSVLWKWKKSFLDLFDKVPVRHLPSDLHPDEVLLGDRAAVDALGGALHVALLADEGAAHAGAAQGTGTSVNDTASVIVFGRKNSPKLFFELLHYVRI